MGNEYYTCALAGITAKESEAPVQTLDELEDLPVGWSKITIQTRVSNPNYINIQKIKKDLVEELLSQVEDEQKEGARVIMKYQIDAQYASLEQITPAYFIEERTCFVSNPNANDQVKEEWDSLLERLDLIDE